MILRFYHTTLLSRSEVELAANNQIYCLSIHPTVVCHFDEDVGLMPQGPKGFLISNLEVRTPAAASVTSSVHRRDVEAGLC